VVALLNPAALEFGRQGVGTTSASRTIHLINVGATALTVTHVAITGADRGDFAARDTCSGTTVGVYAGCTISVRFRPTTTGARRANLVIADTTAGSPQSVPLRGDA
jgi:hypothetical protein